MTKKQISNQYQLLLNDLVATRSLDGKKVIATKIKAFEIKHNYTQHTQHKI